MNNDDFFKHMGLTPPRWALLQEKLRGFTMAEKTPARIMKAMMDDIDIRYDEMVVLAFYLGYSQGEMKPRTGDIRILKARLN